MGSARKYDYKALKLQYVRNAHLSFRDLLRRNGIPENVRASVQRIAKAEGWDEERYRLAGMTTDKTLELVADVDARRQLRIAEVEMDTIDLAGEMVDQMRGRLKKLNPVYEIDEAGERKIVDWRPDLIVRPEELGKLIKGLSDARSSGRSEPPPSPNPGGMNISVPAGTQLAVVARYVEHVRNSGGPIDDEPTASGPAEPIALPSGAS